MTTMTVNPAILATAAKILREGHGLPLHVPDGYDATGKRNNCAIVAFASLTGTPYRDAEDAIWESIRASGNRSRRGAWTGYCWPDQDWPNAAKALGVQGLTFDNRKAGQTVARFAKTADPEKAYAIRVRGHAMILKAGLLMDQNGVAPVAQKAGGFRARQRIKSIVTMEG